MTSNARRPVFDDEHRRLLQSVVEVARAIFAAGASSIFLYDGKAGDLVFEAISGAGEEHLVGTRIPADQGVAGWVLNSGEPLVVNEVAANPIFARTVAESTGYVPESVMAAPLLDDGESIGVLEVLDGQADARRTLGDLDLLGLFANQAALALQVVARSQAAMAGVLENDAVAGVAAALDGLTGHRHEAGQQLLTTITDVLTTEA